MSVTLSPIPTANRLESSMPRIISKLPALSWLKLPEIILSAITDTLGSSSGNIPLITEP